MSGTRRRWALAAAAAAAALLLASCNAVGPAAAGSAAAAASSHATPAPPAIPAVAVSDPAGRELTPSPSGDPSAYTANRNYQPRHTIALSGFPTEQAAAAGAVGKGCSGTLMSTTGGPRPYVFTSAECLYGQDGLRLTYFELQVAPIRPPYAQMSFATYTCTARRSYTDYRPGAADSAGNAAADYAVVVPDGCVHNNSETLGTVEPAALVWNMGTTGPADPQPGTAAAVTGYPGEHTDAALNRADAVYRLWQYRIGSLDLTAAQLRAPLVRVYGVGTKGAIAGAGVTQLCSTGECLIGVVINGGGPIDARPDFVQYRAWDDTVAKHVTAWLTAG